MTRRPHLSRTRGMTLIELVISVAIMSVLAVACGSAVVLASRAMEISADAVGVPSPSAASDRVVADMQTALTFTECGSTSATFTVPDRTGDGLADKLRYAWSGTPGDPLTLSCNDGTSVVIAQDVRVLDFSYLTRTLGGSSGPTVQESDEVELIFHDDVPGAGQIKDRTINKSNAAGTYFRPTLPTNTLHWKITRAVIMAKQNKGGLYDLHIDICPAGTDRLPTSDTMARCTLQGSSIPSNWSWVQATYGSLENLDPAQALCLTVGQDPDAGKSTAKIRFERKLSQETTTPDAHYVISDDAGATWQMSSKDYKRDLLFYVYGTVTTLGEPQWP